MAIRIFSLGYLNSLPLGEIFKPQNTLGKHHIRRIATDVFVNDVGVIYEIPPHVGPNFRIAYDCGVLTDANETHHPRFRAWQSGRYRELEAQIARLDERRCRDAKSASQFGGDAEDRYWRSEGATRIQQEIERLWAEKVMVAAMEPPIRNFVRFRVTYP